MKKPKTETQLERIQRLYDKPKRDEIDRALLQNDWYLSPNERKNYPPAWVGWLKEAAQNGWRMR